MNEEISNAAATDEQSDSEDVLSLRNLSRTERAAIADDTLNKLRVGWYQSCEGSRIDLAEDITFSVQHTVLYTEDDLQNRKKLISSIDQQANPSSLVTDTTSYRRIEIRYCTTLQAAQSLTTEMDENSVGVLNFASAKNPGGGFLKGSSAQEESIARSSSLYSTVIQPRIFNEFYDYNRRGRSGIYSHRIIYSPRVTIFKDDNGDILSSPYHVGMVTVPAPNASVIRQPELIRSTMVERVRRLLCVFEANKHDCLVLGAFGCGVFRNDPFDVATIFRQLLESEEFKDSFKRIIFAVFNQDMPPPRSTGHHSHYSQHHHHNQQQQQSSSTGQTSATLNSSIVPVQPGEIGFDGKMLRKAMARKTVDYNPSIIRYLESSIWQNDITDGRSLQPDVLYIPNLVPPHALLSDPVNCVMTKFIRPATNKVRCPIFCVCWTPDGRRLITGASSGEFTLWNGLTFNFETILQAHDSAVRAMIWSNNEQWMLTGDHNGFVKYWQSNMNNVQVYQAHTDPVRGLTTEKELAGMDDAHEGMIWDMSWHPLGHMLVSGSNDHTTRFWTRNRPGDTVLERSEEGILMHASRLDQMHREELEHERASEEFNMPGLGFEGDLLEQLQQQHDVYNRREAGIPGLDFSNDDDEGRRRR
ncbi:unnamed protein product, partial [Rotaria magnacalcarata]